MRLAGARWARLLFSDCEIHFEDLMHSTQGRAPSFDSLARPLLLPVPSPPTFWIMILARAESSNMHNAYLLFDGAACNHHQCHIITIVLGVIPTNRSIWLAGRQHLTPDATEIGSEAGCWYQMNSIWGLDLWRLLLKYSCPPCKPWASRLRARPAWRVWRRSRPATLNWDTMYAWPSIWSSTNSLPQMNSPVQYELSVQFPVASCCNAGFCWSRIRISHFVRISRAGLCAKALPNERPLFDHQGVSRSLLAPTGQSWANQLSCPLEKGSKSSWWPASTARTSWNLATRSYSWTSRFRTSCSLRKISAWPL